MEDGSVAASLLPQQSSNIGATAHGGSGGGVAAPATAVLIFSTSVALCGSLTFGCALGYSFPAESGIREDAGLSLSAYSVFSSAMTVGGMIGAAFSGKISDLIGRRATMGLAQVFAFFGWLAIALPKSNVWWLDIGRLSVGVGIGALSFVVSNRYRSMNLRGSFTVALQFMMACGVSIMFFIGTIVNWRVLALIGATPSLVQLLGLSFIPESPRWLVSAKKIHVVQRIEDSWILVTKAKCGSDEELEAALWRLRGKGVDISEEYVAIREYTEAFQHISDSGIMNLFEWKYARSLTIPSTIMSALLMDKVGRRPLLLVSVTGMCFSCFLVGLSFLLQKLGQLTNLTPYLVFTGIMIDSVSYTVGIAGIAWVIMSEIFPINIKGSAGSLVSVVNWLCAIAAVYSFNFLAEWSLEGTFFLFLCVNALGVLFIVKLVPETMGRSIEEIQASMTHLR